jgi:hypothetical protein
MFYAESFLIRGCDKISEAVGLLCGSGMSILEIRSMSGVEVFPNSTTEKSNSRRAAHCGPFSGRIIFAAASRPINPRLKISAGVPTWLLFQNSGARYVLSPSCSSGFALNQELKYTTGHFAACPKSPIFNLPLPSIKIFPGFISKCTIFKQ